MVTTTIITTRAQWAKYLEDEAKKMATLQCQVETLRELVQEAFALRKRMPRSWVIRAAKALHQTDAQPR